MMTGRWRRRRRRTYDARRWKAVRIMVRCRIIALADWMIRRVVLVLTTPPIPPFFRIVAEVVSGGTRQNGNDASVERFDSLIRVGNFLLCRGRIAAITV